MRTNKQVSSLYVHIPFCESICDYCDFAKLQYFHSFAEQYLVALEKELKERVLNFNLKTIYIGGGTPTSLNDAQFERLLSMLDEYSTTVEEYTVEANPESLSEQKIKIMKAHKVNRVSIGVESTNDEILRSINRKHTFEDVKKAVRNLKENSINNINLDLIIGLPNVGEKMLMKDIRNILSLNPNHISCYSLTVHEHTVFALNNISEPSEDFSFEAYKEINEVLENSGYEHYEVSNWAKPGYQSKHNLTYWRNERYYGIGLAASGYLDNIRYKNTTNFKEYISFRNKQEIEQVTLDDEKEYEIMLKLRIKEGLNLDDFKTKFGIDLLIDKQGVIRKYVDGGQLILDGNRLIPTFSGMMVLDQIAVGLY